MKIQRIVLVLFFISLVFTQSIFMGVKSVSAISENIVIYEVQTKGFSSSTEELVSLYNKSILPVDISNWCLTYSPASDSAEEEQACFLPEEPEAAIIMLPMSYLTIASQSFQSSTTGFITDFDLKGGFADPGGHIRLYNSFDQEIDKVGWGTALDPELFSAIVHKSGQRIQRIGSDPVDTDNNLLDFVVVELCMNFAGAILPAGFGKNTDDYCFPDFCLNLEGAQEYAPEGFIKAEGEDDCIELILENSPLIITELLPNAPSNDAGLEFIEIYNPNTETIELAGYSVQIGPDFSEKYTFTSGNISSGQYLVFTDTHTGLVLPNTTGVQLRLVAPAGNIVSSSLIYNEADDNVSWALVEDQWIYTNQITPNSANKPYLEPAQEEVIGVTSILAPCPAGKYRNPETNRCRTIETAVSILAPCDEDEYRNPETNRCRKASTVSKLTPCKAGQVRNPETNRCRTIETASALSACPEGQARNPDTNRCRKVSVLGATSETDLSTVQDVKTNNTKGSLNWTVIIATLGATLAYIIYEWRTEIRHKLYLIRNK